MEIITEKDFSGFQLFKILMNSKLKSKVPIFFQKDFFNLIILAQIDC